MSRLVGALLLLYLNMGFTYGMDCTFGNSKNIVDQVIHQCPGFLDSSDKSYCCLGTNGIYCCDAEEFALQAGIGIVLPVVITAAIIISLIVCCVSCLCCSCCPWYRRRHQGTVYGKVQAPSTVHVVQTLPPAVPPGYSNQEAYQNQYILPYPTSTTGYPQQPPPQYTSEPYAKQAPYNPSYPPQ